MVINSNYTIFRDLENKAQPAVCYRTEIALRCLVTDLGKLQDFIDENYEGESEERSVQERTVDIIEEFKANCLEMEGKIKSIKISPVEVTELLSKRWRQLYDLAGGNTKYI